MTTSTERARALRAKRKAEGLQEVRGIWAPPAQHAAIREMARNPNMDVAAERERWAQHLDAIAARRDADDPHARSLRWIAAEMRALTHS